VGDGARLPGAGAGQDADRPGRGGDGRALLVVESGEHGIGPFRKTPARN
jgi:hypothetical protein